MNLREDLLRQTVPLEVSAVILFAVAGGLVLALKHPGNQEAWRKLQEMFLAVIGAELVSRRVMDHDDWEAFKRGQASLEF
jgi:hypothetical protein